METQKKFSKRCDDKYWENHNVHTIHAPIVQNHHQNMIFSILFFSWFPHSFLWCSVYCSKRVERKKKKKTIKTVILPANGHHHMSAGVANLEHSTIVFLVMLNLLLCFFLSLWQSTKHFLFFVFFFYFFLLFVRFCFFFHSITTDVRLGTESINHGFYEFCFDTFFLKPRVVRID